jgi:hypothetical protein
MRSTCQAPHLGQQRTPEGYERCIALYQQALAIDANDAAAWTGLALNYINQFPPNWVRSVVVTCYVPSAGS